MDKTTHEAIGLAQLAYDGTPHRSKLPFVVYGCVSMSTRPDPWGLGAVEIATRNGIIPGSVGLTQAHPQIKPPAMKNSLTPDLVQLRSTLPIRALVLMINTQIMGAKTSFGQNSFTWLLVIYGALQLSIYYTGINICHTCSTYDSLYAWNNTSFFEELMPNIAWKPLAW